MCLPKGIVAVIPKKHRAQVRKLIRDNCAYYAPDGTCLQLDTRCSQLHCGLLICPTFATEVLPLDLPLQYEEHKGSCKGCSYEVTRDRKSLKFRL